MTTARPPWPEAAYRLDLPDPVPADLSRLAGAVFDRVWRTTPDRPGFAVVRFTRPPGSHELRQTMLRLARALPVRFVPERLGRFDQQVTSRFHRDGAPAASLLMLGYEASAVRSRLFVADAYLAAAAAGLGIADYLAAFNPLFPAGEAKLWPVATELALPLGEPCIVVINNSLTADAAGGTQPLGVLHKAEVPTPNPSASRVINSVGLMLADDPSGTPKDAAAVDHFLTRTDLD